MRVIGLCMCVRRVDGRVVRRGGRSHSMCEGEGHEGLFFGGGGVEVEGVERWDC